MAETLAELAETWLIWRDTLRPSPATLRARRADLAAIGELIGLELTRTPTVEETDRLRRWLTVLSPADLTPDTVVAAFAAYRQHRAAASLRRCRSTWMHFCTWLKTEKQVLDWNPIELVERPKGHRWVPRPLSTDDLERVVTAAQTPSPRAHHPWPELEQVLCALFVGAGLRVSEAIGARVEDFHPELHGHPVISVVGKGSVIRVVPLSVGVVDILYRYLESRRQRLGHPLSTSPLLVRAQGGPLSPKTVDNLVLGWFRRADVQPPSGALSQSLRHTYASMMIDQSSANRINEILLGSGHMTSARHDSAPHIDSGTTDVLIAPASSGG